jgi:hypothetical protein
MYQMNHLRQMNRSDLMFLRHLMNQMKRKRLMNHYDLMCLMNL